MQNNKYSQQRAIELGIQGNINRDYKQYKLKKGDVEGTLGCAVFVFGSKLMFDTWGEDACLTAFDQIIEKNNL